MRICVYARMPPRPHDPYRRCHLAHRRKEAAMDHDSVLDRTSNPVPVVTHSVLGGGGVRLHTREWGNPRGKALLFIHGWSQSDLCWLNQVRSDLAETFRIVTFDLRGHGLSEKPAGTEPYADGQLWAEDVASVIDQTGLQQPILVAWSYGGYIVADYLRSYGDTRIGGINLVGAAMVLRPPAFDHIGPGMLENVPGMCAPDLSANIAATQRFLRACTSRPLGGDEMAAALAWNMAVPSTVRGALLSRELDASEILASISVPVLVTHGREDRIVLPSMAEHTLTVCPAATASWYDGVGHMPFWEAPERFTRELAGLASGLTTSATLAE
jgi:pimeloyl-ACP methyl ester carboxylesterase